jgi:hypothetical protein
MGARHLSGFVTYKVLHLSGNFMLKRAEFTCVLPFAWTIHNDRLFQQKQQTTFPYYHLLEKLNNLLPYTTFQDITFLSEHSNISI